MMSSFNFAKKGQGSLEYLLIIGGALLVAVVVITLIISINSSGTQQSQQSNDSYQAMLDSTIVPPVIVDIDCNILSNTKVYLTPSPTQGVSTYRLKVNNTIYPTDLTLSSGVIQATSSLINITSDGNSYDISAIAMKDGFMSTPSSPAITCVAHN